MLDDKWQATVSRRIVSEVDALTSTLVGRIEGLGARYAHTLSELDAALEQLASKIDAHLADMGVK